jgi:hypothetical protein
VRFDGHIRRSCCCGGAGEWQAGGADVTSVCLQVRNLSAGAAHVLLGPELVRTGFLEACKQGPMAVEVRDRDARPQALQLLLPKDDSPPTPPSRPPADAAVERPGSKESKKPVKKVRY